MNTLQAIYPQRIVCLSAETPEILDHMGAFDRIVGVSGFARRPAKVRKLPKMGGFSDPDINKIVALSPDLVITTSDIQSKIAAQCIERGIPLLALNPYRLQDIWTNILLMGGALGLQQEATALVGHLQCEFNALQQNAPTHRPRVYFEEWPEPMISGIGWVGDLIHLVGGEDIFPEHATQRLARDRFVTPEAVLARKPDVIIASWCGKRADLASICRRKGWDTLPAVQNGAVYEIESDAILQTGPGLIRGALQLAALIHQPPARSA